MKKLLFVLLLVSVLASCAFPQTWRNGFGVRRDEWEAYTKHQIDTSAYLQSLSSGLPRGSRMWIGRGGYEEIGAGGLEVYTWRRDVSDATVGGFLHAALYLTLYCPSAVSYTREDSATSLVMVWVEIDGVVAVDCVRVDDWCGASELCAPIAGEYFGKSEMQRDTTGTAYTYQQFYSLIPMSARDSLKIKLYRYGADYRATSWFPMCYGFQTPKYLPEYNYRAIATTKEMGRYDFVPVCELTTDTAGGDAWGRVRAFSIYYGCDGQSREPMPYAHTRTQISNGGMLEDLSFVGINGAAPLFTTLAIAAHRGDTLIKVNADLTDWVMMPYASNEVGAILYHGSHQNMMMGSAFWDTTPYAPVFSAADSTIKVNPADSLRDSFCAGSPVLIFAVDTSQYSIHDVAMLSGIEELMQFFAYYGTGNVTHQAGWSKRGVANAAATLWPNEDQPRAYWGLAEAATYPQSMFTDFRYTYLSETFGGEARGLNIYVARNYQQDNNIYFGRSRWITHCWLEGAAGVKTNIPTYAYTLETDTIKITIGRQDGYAKMYRDTTGISWTWANLVNCNSGSIFYADYTSTATRAYAYLNTKTLENWAAYFAFNLTALDNFDPSQIDSAYWGNVYFNALPNDSLRDTLYTLIAHPKVPDSLTLTDSSNCYGLRTFGPWGRALGDSLPICKMLISGKSTGTPYSFKMMDQTIRNAPQYYTGKGWYMPLMIADRGVYDVKCMHTTSPFITIRSYEAGDGAGSQAPYLILYRRKPIL